MKPKELFQKLYKKVYDRNYTCYLCRSEVFSGETFCDACRKILSYNLVFCPRCGRKTALSGYCPDCKARLPLFDKARSAFAYEGDVRNLIYAFKNGNPDMAEGFARECLPFLKGDFSDADFITFVPMTKKAKYARGYNQSEIFARSLSALTNLPAEELFEKVRDTSEQKNLKSAERQKNLKGAFHLKRRALCRGKRILLADDTLTTGATAGELAKLLKGAHAEKVYLLTIASVEAAQKNYEGKESEFTET